MLLPSWGSLPFCATLCRVILTFQGNLPGDTYDFGLGIVNSHFFLFGKLPGVTKWLELKPSTQWRAWGQPGSGQSGHGQALPEAGWEMEPEGLSLNLALSTRYGLLLQTRFPQGIFRKFKGLLLSTGVRLWCVGTLLGWKRSGHWVPLLFWVLWFCSEIKSL